VLLYVGRTRRGIGREDQQQYLKELEGGRKYFGARRTSKIEFVYK
jgi:hypothetical protein